MSCDASIVALLKAQVSLQLEKISSPDKNFAKSAYNTPVSEQFGQRQPAVSVYIMYSYM